MSTVEHVPIVIQGDFIARQTRALPVGACAELIWNSLDGEANRVNVELERADLGGDLRGGSVHQSRSHKELSIIRAS